MSQPVISRLFDPVKCRLVTDKYPTYCGALSVEAWLGNLDNWAFTDGEGNIGFAEWKNFSNYWIHFCFDNARGREAVELTKAMLATLEDCVHEYQTGVGIIEQSNPKAGWVVRQAGLKLIGTVVRDGELCNMFLHTRSRRS